VIGDAFAEPPMPALFTGEEKNPRRAWASHSKTLLGLVEQETIE